MTPTVKPEVTRRRPGIHTYYMMMAQLVASRSTCPRAYVGAIIVKDGQVISTGYNGAPSDLHHCTDVGHLLVDGHCVRTVHAEINAVIQAALHGTSTDGATCYVTHAPCIHCAKALINAGIQKVFYLENYGDGSGLEFFDEAGVEHTQYSAPTVEIKWSDNDK